MAELKEKDARILRALQERFTQEGVQNRFIMAEAQIEAAAAGIDVTDRGNIFNVKSDDYHFYDSFEELHRRSFVRKIGYDYRIHENIYELTESGKEYVLVFPGDKQ